MFSSALRRNVCNSTLNNFKQCLLNALAAYVSGNRRIFGFSGYFIDFIDINNAAFRTFNVIIRRLDKLQKNILDVLTYISCFGECSCVGNRKRNVKRLCKRLSKQSFTNACGSQKEHVAFCKIYAFIVCVSTLIMIVNRNAESNLSVILTDYIFIKNSLYFLRL